MNSVQSFPSPSIFSFSQEAPSASIVQVGIPYRDVLQAPAYSLQNNLFTYVDQTKNKSGVTFDQALQRIQEGKEFVSKLRAGELTQCTRAQKRRYALSFTWYLISKAIEKGQGFKQGMLVFEDPGHTIRDFFGSCASKRWSSHYRGRVLGNNFGIDIPVGLPYKFHTVLFGGLSVLGQNQGEWTFLKPENHGVESFGQLFLHCCDYLVSLHELLGKEQGPLDHKEDLLPVFKKHKHAMKVAGVVLPALRKQNWGISGVIAALCPYMENEELFKELHKNARRKAAIVSFLEDLLPHYDWAHIRHGNEVVISDREDPSRSELAYFLARLKS